ncbi:sensor domain-containing diguanylate cyclase [Petrachloros mirabilis]
MTDESDAIRLSKRWLSRWISGAYEEIRRLPTDRPHRFATFLIVLISLVILSCIAWGAWMVERRLVTSAGHSLVQAASDSASKLELMINERHGDIEMLASSPIAQSDDRAAVTSYLYHLIQTYRAYQWIGITDAKGRLIASTDPTILSEDRRTSPWFQEASKSTGVTIIDALVTDEGTRKPNIIIAAPIRTLDGRFRGTVAAKVEVPYLVDLLDRTTRVLRDMAWDENSNIEYQLLKRNGDLIADSNLRQEGRLNLKTLGLPSAQLVAISGQGFVEEEHLRRKTPVITGYAQVNISQPRHPLQWGILIRVDRESILAPIKTFLKNLLLVITLIVLPLALLLIWLVKRLHHEWHQAKQESLRASQAEAALGTKAGALHALVHAAKSMTSAPHFNELSLAILEIARSTTKARFAVLGILDTDHRQLTRCVTIGLDEASVHAIGSLPVEGGILHCLTRREGVLRVDDLRSQTLSTHHPLPHLPLTSFLGISLRCHGQLFGQIYLIEKVSRDGDVTAFTDLDEQVLTMLSAQAAVSIENLQLLQDSRERALRDSLTSLLNHSATLDALNRELFRTEREHERLAVIMADLDHFKRINDTYGHRVGDTVLREVAKRIQEATRRYDLVGRVGGEEFLIILPRCDEASASEFAERIRLAVGGNPIDTPAGPLSVTISIGATTWSNGNPAIPHLLWETADQALYRVKQNGRNEIAFMPLPLVASFQSAA